MLLGARPSVQPSLHTAAALFQHAETRCGFARANVTLKQMNSFDFNSWKALPQPRAAPTDGSASPFIPPPSLARHGD